MFDSDTLATLLLFAVVNTAVVGGLTAAIVRIVRRQRAVEMLYRERLARWAAEAERP